MFRNNRGFTLVEMLIAMVIILIAMLGLYQSVIVSVNSNVQNVLRDEGVKITEQIINEIKSISYADIDVAAPWSTGNWNAVLGYVPPLQRTVRNMPPVNYNAVVAVTESAPIKQVRVVVGWNYRGENPARPTTGMEFEHVITTMVKE